MQNIKTKRSTKKLNVANRDDFRQKLISTYRYLSCGGFSTVYMNTDNISVIKITNDAAYIDFVEDVVLKNKNIHFPKIYEIATLESDAGYLATAIVIEKLRLSWALGVKNKTSDKIFSTIKKHSNSGGNSLTNYPEYPASFKKSIELLKTFKRLNGYELDFSITKYAGHNIMFRKNNDLVITDPFYL